MGLWYSSFFTLLTLIAVPSLADVSVLPTNSTTDLAWSSSARFRIQGSSPLSGQILAPLTHYLVNLSSSQAQGFDVAGTLTEVTATNSLGINSTVIACIPCDDSSADYPGELGVDQTVQGVITAAQPAAAIILYSASATHCNLTTNDQTEAYRYIFTFTQSNAFAALNQTLVTAPNKTVSINPTMSTYTAATTADPGSTNPGDSPNTAMIILYSITGIITALFLGIIITGAVRAHRHPERYGPRRVAGRPRQSRARGIAQAMLDTIPVVKFGDNTDVDAAKRDVEMANADDPNGAHSPPTSESISDVEAPHETELPTSEHAVTGPAASTTSESNPNAAPDGGNFSCPICTDDFIKGQDLRVLPCNHQFHPECIDPWLVNVSGTCPLCRIDLNPPKPEENAEQEGENAEPQNTDTVADEITSPTTPGVQSNRHSHRLTNYLHGPLNARRMRNATVEERLAALRHVREANQGEAAGEDDATRPNRNRLSTRLRDRFRIRTRAHGVDLPTPVESGAATPTVPPAAHTTN